MDLALGPEQKQLKENVERFARERYDDRERRRRASEPGGFSRDDWAEIAALGWIGAGLPEAAGGFGGGPEEIMIVMRGVGGALMQEPILPGVMAAAALSAAGASSAIGALVAGEEIVAPIFGQASEAVLVKTMDGALRVDGAIPPILNADAADALLLRAKREPDDAPLMLKISPEAEGVIRKPTRLLDGRHGAAIEFRDARVPPGAVIAEGEAAERAFRAAEDQQLAALCAEAAGAAQALFDRTLAYLKERRQFGRPIGEFQAIQHRMADLFVALKETDALVTMATVKMTEPPSDARAKSLAVAVAGVLPRCLLVGREAIQLHGGMGMTDELPVGAGFKRLKTIELMLGGADRYVDRVAAGGGVRDLEAT